MKQIDVIKDNNTLRHNDFGEQFLYSINRDIFDKVSAKSFYIKEFEPVLFNPNKLYIIIGTDSGLLPQFLMQQELPEGSRYLFIEPDHILSQLKQYRLIPSDLNDRIIITTPDLWEEKAHQLKIREYSYIRSVVQQKAICAQHTYMPEYTELSWAVAEQLETLHFGYSSSLGCKLFLIRQIQNIADNTLPAIQLKNIYKDKTGIILAGGPSLATLLPWVKQHRDKLVIFSVSRISKILLDFQIEPDIVVSVDPLDENLDVSKEMFHFKNSIFVHSFHVTPSIVSQWPNKKFYLGDRFPWKSKNNPVNTSPSGATVSNSALSVARICGCNTILLAGFDLCYSENGITHSAGSDEASLGPSYDSSLLTVTTYSGKQHTTKPEFFIALKGLEQHAKLLQKDGTTVINLAKNAAVADNVEHISPEKINLTDKQDNTPLFSLEEPDDKTLTAHYKSILNELAYAQYQISSIHKLAKRALKINASMYSETGQIENYKDKQALDKIEQRLRKQHRTFSVLVKSFGIESFIKITTPHEDNDDWTAEKAQDMGKIYYSAYQAGAEQLLVLLKDSEQRVRTRQEECQPSPDFSKLFDRWEKDKSYGRAIIWKKSHPDYLLPEKTHKNFLRLEQSFNSLLNNKQSNFRKLIEKTTDLKLLNTRASLLFNHKKEQELRNLYNGLQHHPAPIEQKKPYEELLSAYLCELEHKSEQALKHYNEIINNTNQELWEIALNRITSLSIELNNTDNALLSLKCLSDISPLYLPFYADACRLTGDYLQAIDCYNRYIAFFPDDLVSKIQLVNLYLEMGVYDAAVIMLDLLEQTYPDQPNVLQLKEKVIRLSRQKETTT